MFALRTDRNSNCIIDNNSSNNNSNNTNKNGDGSIDCDELTQEVCGVAAAGLDDATARARASRLPKSSGAKSPDFKPRASSRLLYLKSEF